LHGVCPLYYLWVIIKHNKNINNEAHAKNSTNHLRPYCCIYASKGRYLNYQHFKRLNIMNTLNKIIIYFLGEEAEQDKGELLTALLIASLCAFLLPLL
jgi:hypothetical protein